MITLLTGLPGNGKTLMALAMAEALCRKDNRPLFIMGIELTDEFPLPYEKVPPVKDWTIKKPLEEDPSVMAPSFNFPVNAVIVIDECQKVFRPRSASTPPPDHVQAFETHRHEGIDFILLTQHPMLLDANIRRLTNQHIHMVRAFGAQAASVHEWQQCKEQPDKIRVNSQNKIWAFPKHIYTWYKSSKSHTYKFRPPLRAVLLILGPLLVALCIYIAVSWFSSKSEVKPPLPGQKAATESGSSSRPAAPSLADYQPLLAGAPWTAPRYAQATQPVSPPAPAGCVFDGRVCSCYSDQGVKVDVKKTFCISMANDGFHRDWMVKNEKTVATR